MSAVLNLSNEVVKMRADVKRIKVLLIRKLTRQISVLQKKKGKEGELEKYRGRVVRLQEEIHTLKALVPDQVTKAALKKDISFQEVCRGKGVSLHDRATARIATHPQFNKKIQSIKAVIKAFKKERMNAKRENNIEDALLKNSISENSKASSEASCVPEEIIKMRKVAKRARVVILGKMAEELASLKKKKSEDSGETQSQERAAGILKEMQALRNLKPDQVITRALQENTEFEKTLLDPQADPMDRAIAHIVIHSKFIKKLQKVKEEKEKTKEKKSDKVDMMQSKNEDLESENEEDGDSEEEEEDDDDDDDDDNNESEVDNVIKGEKGNFKSGFVSSKCADPVFVMPPSRNDDMVPDISPSEIQSSPGQSSSAPVIQQSHGKCSSTPGIQASPDITPVIKQSPENSSTAKQKSSSASASQRYPEKSLIAPAIQRSHEMPCALAIQGSPERCSSTPIIQQSPEKSSNVPQKSSNAPVIQRSPIKISTKSPEEFSTATQKSSSSPDFQRSVKCFSAPNIQSSELFITGCKTEAKKKLKKADQEIKTPSKSQKKQDVPLTNRLETEKVEEESDLSDEEEEKEYFDDSTEERFHKQSSQSEDDDVDDFFLGKVSKFRKRKTNKGKVEEKKREIQNPDEKITGKRQEIGLGKMESVFCSTLSKSVICSQKEKYSSQSEDPKLHRFEKQSKSPVGRGKGFQSKESELDSDRKIGLFEPNKPTFKAVGQRRAEPLGAGRGRSQLQRRQNQNPKGTAGKMVNPLQDLHPSWEASRKRKEQQAQITVFKGKKIRFDDD
ncbi:hypothetical protein DNTS_004968 [Danionella cerebrum]|uniref:Uncharacterized protein n=1 Tax=Danionella cerebrum TaxID=2873325 RepID=A0A553QP81_9TELE|nr:hypothetical protein DNTS_004968 [Danionella translucida]TRY91529.1 hypothetical protein DNTS_004968 [Danionella translucida]